MKFIRFCVLTSFLSFLFVTTFLHAGTLGRSKVKLLIADVEHILTAVVHVSDTGSSYTFTLKDLASIKRARENNVHVILFCDNPSGSFATWVTKYGVTEVYHVEHNTKNTSRATAKQKLIEKIVSKYFVTTSEIAYISNDPEAVQVCKIVGFACCTQTAPATLQTACVYVSSKQEGDGALSDVVEKILAK